MRNNLMGVEHFLVLDTINIAPHMKVVRDDLFPFLYGGNKARKAVEYEKWLKEGGYNAIVTTGGIQSNHNRAIALLAARNRWKCHIVYHGSNERFKLEKGNALLVRLSGATMEFVNENQISEAMNIAMDKFRTDGLKPFYITGGGHDLPGGIAYVKAVQELKHQCEEINYKPNCIVLASGTGSTQAGIIVGLELVGWNDVKVVGISVAREEKRGRQVIVDFANRLGRYYGINKQFDNKVYFNTDYLFGGYEQTSIKMCIYLDEIMHLTGLMFDYTYSGKGFYGMMDLMKQNKICGDVLFWHTGGLMNLMN